MKCIPAGVRVLFLLAMLLPGSRTSWAAEAEKKAFFLPKSPVAAAYVLGRLSNQELIEAPRSEFVYVALLQRPGLDRKYRLEALEGLAKLRQTNPLAELLGALGELDKKGTNSTASIKALSPLLLETKASELSPKREAIAELTAKAQLPGTRQAGYAALITADGSAAKAWALASDAKHLPDLLVGVPLVREAKLRGEMHAQIFPLLKSSEPDTRRAAIMAIAAVPGQETAVFKALAALVQAGTERAACISSLQRLPRKFWHMEAIEPLAASLVTFLEKTPVRNRTQPDFLEAKQFTAELAGLLPEERNRSLNRILRGLGVQVIVLKTLHEQMFFDQTRLVIEAGKAVEIVFENNDIMPHNLVITTPGAREEIGQLADKMAPAPDAQGRMHVPNSPKVLHATRMLEPGQKAKLSFTAPTEPGEYPYVCTFPGHWIRMYGTLVVTRNVEEYLAKNPAPTAPTITEWKLADLTGDLGKLDQHRNYKTGKELFTSLSCAQCHQLGKEGSAFGPPLNGLFAKYKGDRQAVLEQIIDPSRQIEEKYRNHLLERGDEDLLSGLLLAEDGATFTIQTGPSEALVQKVKKSEIKSRRVQELSLMPAGLLNMLNKEQILDLLAYLLAEGNASHAAFKHLH